MGNGTAIFHVLTDCAMAALLPPGCSRQIGVNRTAYRYEPVRLPDEDDIRAEIIDKVCNFGRVGYRMVTDMMRNEGAKINHKKVEHVLNIIEILKSKHVALISLKENFDTVTPQDKFMITIFGALAEIERETTLQRQVEGIAAAKIAGKRFAGPL